MKSIVVMTYYQLMHSIALALTFEEKPMLYFTCDYIKADEALLQRIRETNIFHDVVGMSEAGFIVPFIDELRAAYGKSNSEIDSIGDSIFEKYLESYYAKIFKDANTAEEIYVYNDFQRHYYYVAKHFSHIIGIEDGYKSLAQQIRVHRFKGRYKLIEPFIDKYYPAPLYKNKNIKKIISSTDFPDIDDYYKSLLEVIDFAELIEKNKDSYVKALLHIFCIEGIHVKENSTLYLGQPMSRGLYCTAGENYLLHKKVIEDAIAQGQNVYIKPHPADTLDYNLYKNEHVQVLPKAFPLEVLGYTGIKFDRSISFGSTSLVGDFVNESIKIYTNPDGKIHDIRKFVREFIKDERIQVNLYLKAREMTPEAYINLYGYILEHPYIDYTFTVLLDEGFGSIGEEYFQLDNMALRVRQFKTMKKDPKKTGMFELQIKNLPSLLKKFPRNTEIKFISAKWENDFDLYVNYVAKDRFDYFMIADLEDSGFPVIDDLNIFMDKIIAAALLFNNYTYLDSGKKAKIYLGRGSEVYMLMKRMSNILFHKSLCTELDQITSGMGSIDLLSPYVNDDNFVRRASISMYVDIKEYQKTFDGEKEYALLVQDLCQQAKDQPTFAINAISMLLYDYYNWGQIHYFAEQKDLLKSFVGNISCDNNTLKYATLNFAELLLQDQKTEHNKIIYQNESFYKYSKDATDLLIRKKTMLRAQIRVARIRKLREYLKGCRDYVAGIGGEDFARKLEETAMMRKLYHFVTKKEREVK